MDRALLAWSGGKDAAYCLYQLLMDDVEVVGLLTTFNERFDRSSMHGVRRSLYEKQASALELSLHPVMLPAEPSNEEYESIMAREIEVWAAEGVRYIVFADIFLEEVRSYREEQLDSTPIEGSWPLWGRNTEEIVSEFLDAGFRATVVAVDGEALDESFVGREFDETFLEDLPRAVDPCGENGEFHTFVWDGPIFETSLSVHTTGTITRTIDGNEFHYAELRAQ